VTSVKGGGSVFRVSLPYGDGAAPSRSEGSQ
jgi:hypothetical protein